MVAGNHVGFTDIIPLSRRLIRPGLCPQGYKVTITAASLHSPGNTSTDSIIKLFKNPSSGTFKTAKYKMSQSHINDNIDRFSNTNSPSNVQNNSTAADQKSQILVWLSGLEPSIQHQDIQAHRADGVGEWLLQTEEYQNWFGGVPDKSDGSALFCYGGGGVGKTYVR